MFFLSIMSKICAGCLTPPVPLNCGWVSFHHFNHFFFFFCENNVTVFHVLSLSYNTKLYFCTCCSCIMYHTQRWCNTLETSTSWALTPAYTWQKLQVSVFLASATEPPHCTVYVLITASTATVSHWLFVSLIIFYATAVFTPRNLHLCFSSYRIVDNILLKA